MSPTKSVSSIAAVILVGAAFLPVSSRAQDWQERRHRKEVRNQWKGLGVASGAVGVVGLLSHNSGLAALGIGGALYSTYRYDQDRRNSRGDGHYRAMLFARPSFDYRGHHYIRHTVWRSGHEYYRFDRSW